MGIWNLGIDRNIKRELIENEFWLVFMIYVIEGKILFEIVCNYFYFLRKVLAGK